MNTVSLINNSILNSDTNKRLYTGKEEENNVFINTMSINNPTKKVYSGDIDPEFCFNSKALSPAGQSSMPSLDINNKRQNGYKLIIQAFKQALKDTNSSLGKLAVVCDMASDEIEATRYVAAISEETKEHVWIVILYDVAKYDQLFKWENKVMYIKDQDE
ncbi:24852_t:CDS:2, partial [Racocetra persica]